MGGNDEWDGHGKVRGYTITARTQVPKDVSTQVHKDTSTQGRCTGEGKEKEEEVRGPAARRGAALGGASSSW